jgi:sugar/nucleoside kinase (ribokinase family)
MDVVCVGDCGIDHYLPSGERLPGGITANFAQHARQEFDAADDVRIVSCVGDDDGAAMVLASLAESGIDCHISSLAGRTPVQFIEIEADGEKHFVRYDEGVLRDFRFDGGQEALIAAADLVVAPVYLQIVGLYETLLSIETSGKVAVDFADFLAHPDFGLLDKHIDRIDIGFFGLRSTDEATIDALSVRARDQDKLFVVTLGPDGSLVFHGDRRYACAAAPVARVIDTTGAGDAYAAGFLSRWCHGAGIQESMEHGAALAASVVGRLGSQPEPSISGGAR